MNTSADKPKKGANHGLAKKVVVTDTKTTPHTDKEFGSVQEVYGAGIISRSKFFRIVGTGRLNNGYEFNYKEELK